MGDIPYFLKNAVYPADNINIGAQNMNPRPKGVGVMIFCRR